MGGIKTGRFIESAFRRARKYGGIVGVATQSFEDFEKSDAARAAISNAAWQLIRKVSGNPVLELMSMSV